MKAAYANLLSTSYWNSLGSFRVDQPNGAGPSNFDWHRAAVAKTMQHPSMTSGLLLPAEHNCGLFSTVQLYRQSSKLYSPVFTGASKFHCKDCSASYDRLVDLTVHMSETGHYRDESMQANGTDASGKQVWSKPRKRSLLEIENKEEAQKVLRCLCCGHAFESLQDLSVHMIRTKHYQKVPLREPMLAVSAKPYSPVKKRLHFEAFERSCSSPESMGSDGMPDNTAAPLAAPPNNTNHNNPGRGAATGRSVHQNGTSYSWQFETQKAQILKCMECGSSHGSLQQLTAHMMATGHFMKLARSASRRSTSLNHEQLAHEDKIQSVPLAPSGETPMSVTVTGTVSSKSEHAKRSSIHETHITESLKIHGSKKKTPPSQIKEKNEADVEKNEVASADVVKEQGLLSHFDYLKEEDLSEGPQECGLDILKSLENTVASIISKAQNGSPHWSGYSSIHAAYQLPMPISQASVQSKSFGNSIKLPTMQLDCAQSPVGRSPSELSSPAASISPSPPGSPDSVKIPVVPSPPVQPLMSNVRAMEELVRKMTEKATAKGTRDRSDTKMRSRNSVEDEVKLREIKREPGVDGRESAVEQQGNLGDMKRSVNMVKSESQELLVPTTRASLGEADVKIEGSDSPSGSMSDQQSPCDLLPMFDNMITNGMETTCETPGQMSTPTFGGGLTIITEHLGEPSLVNPLSALQSVMNAHLGKAAKPLSPALLDPLSRLHRISTGTAGKSMMTTLPAASLQSRQADRGVLTATTMTVECIAEEAVDQPIDLTKTRAEKHCGVVEGGSAPLMLGGSPVRENALSDISALVRNLAGRLTPKPTAAQVTSTVGSSNSNGSSRNGNNSTEKAFDSRRQLSDCDSGTTTTTTAHDGSWKRKAGRQSAWNPHHLLLLQAQFAASLRQASDGRYVLTDLTPHERLRVARATGLSASTISHWLANVKYQLRRTGGTKFLKHMETGRPIFYCSDCALQFRTPLAYVGHVETHLGFGLRDVARAVGRSDGQCMSPSLAEDTEKSSVSPTSGADTTGGSHRCRLCSRSFASRNALKLHHNKSHTKASEDTPTPFSGIEKSLP
uniref:teashirt homolog 3-like n=1 Tax=Myxine glutinosa TaxID=7769 RepID=UPI00358F48A6